ncbi:MAG TPA: hypothetical protein VGR30_10915 [Candidatus Binatia bacterium]|jgi:hypothetical protein|nr:hypothetical protein [Candidatus Binatia bacterium]
MSNEETGGPYLGIAVLCEKVLHDKDGVLSLIRVVDRLTVTASEIGKPPEQMPPVTVNLEAVIMFKSGTAKGNYTVTLRPVLPSGRLIQEISLPILLEGEDRGVNLVINVGLQAQEEGLYWFDVLLNGELITRMPLRLQYQRIALGSAGTPIH